MNVSVHAMSSLLSKILISIRLTAWASDGLAFMITILRSFFSIAIHYGSGNFTFREYCNELLNNSITLRWSRIRNKQRDIIQSSRIKQQPLIVDKVKRQQRNTRDPFIAIQKRMRLDEMVKQNRTLFGKRTVNYLTTE